MELYIAIVLKPLYANFHGNHSAFRKHERCILGTDSYSA